MMARIVVLWMFLCILEVSSWLTTTSITTPPSRVSTSSLAATFVIGTNTSALSSSSDTINPPPSSASRTTPLVNLTPDVLQRKVALSRGDLLKEKECTTTGSVWSLHTRDSFVQVIDSKSGTDQLTVVKFHAHYCKTCQRMSIPFKQLSKSYEQIHFVRLEATEDFSSDHLRSLGVESFPFLQIYRGSQCVASFKGGGPYFRRKLQDTIDECLKRTNWEAFYQEFRPYMEQNARARSGLVVGVQQTQALTN